MAVSYVSRVIIQANFFRVQLLSRNLQLQSLYNDKGLSLFTQRSSTRHSRFDKFIFGQSSVRQISAAADVNSRLQTIFLFADEKHALDKFGTSDVSESLNVGSVTRFGEISPLWCNVKKLWPFCKGPFSFRQNFVLFRQLYQPFAQFSLLPRAKYSNNNPAIWSHCVGTYCLQEHMLSFTYIVWTGVCSYLLVEPENTYHRGITVLRTSCLNSLDSAKQVKMMLTRPKPSS